MAEKQGEVKKITQKDAPEFKGAGEEIKKDASLSHEGTKKTSIITMMHGKPHRVYFEDGKQAKTEELV